MKKLFIICLLVLAAITVSAQDVNKQTYAFSLNSPRVTKTYAVSDSVSSTRDSLAVNFDVGDIPFANFYNFKVHIYELSSPGRTTVQVQGRVYSNDSWTNITTATYTGVGTDSTIAFTANTVATPQFYNQYRILLVRKNGKVRLDYVRGIIKAY